MFFKVIIIQIVKILTVNLMKYSIISDKYKHYFCKFVVLTNKKTKMYLTAGNFILIASIIIFVALLASRASFKFGVPVLLLFLFTGMLFGSDGLGLQFNDMNLAQFIGMVALSIILFSGGMDTDYKSIRPVLAPGIALSTVGVLLTTLITGVFIYFLCNRLFDMAGYTLVFSLLLAATMSSTDSASVFNVLRSRKTGLKHNLKPLLEFESGSNDPMAYMLTIVLIQILLGDNSSFGSIVLTFFAQLAIGALAGFGNIFQRMSLTVADRLVGPKVFYGVLCLIFAAYCGLSIYTNIFYRGYFPNIYFWADQQRMNSLAEETIEKYGTDGVLGKDVYIIENRTQNKSGTQQEKQQWKAIQSSRSVFSASAPSADITHGSMPRARMRKWSASSTFSPRPPRKSGPNLICRSFRTGVHLRKSATH